MNTFELTISSPDKELYKGDAAALSCTTPVGKITILANHSPFSAIAVPGVISYRKKEESSNIKLELPYGAIVEFSSNKCCVLVN